MRSKGLRQKEKRDALLTNNSSPSSSENGFLCGALVPAYESILKPAYSETTCESLDGCFIGCLLYFFVLLYPLWCAYICCLSTYCWSTLVSKKKNPWINFDWNQRMRCHKRTERVWIYTCTINMHQAGDIVIAREDAKTPSSAKLRPDECECLGVSDGLTTYPGRTPPLAPPQLGWAPAAPGDPGVDEWNHLGTLAC